MIDLDYILQKCRENPQSLLIVIPFTDKYSTSDKRAEIKRLKIENPYYDESKVEPALRDAAERLRDAPQKLKEMGESLLRDLVKDWKFESD